jgi:hypothetical protein
MEQTNQYPPWEVHEYYWLSPGKQSSRRHKIDSCYRLTMAKISQALGRVPSSFGTPEDMAYNIAGIRRKTYTPKQQIDVQRGILLEPVARDWLSETIVSNTTLIEMLTTNLNSIQNETSNISSSSPGSPSVAASPVMTSIYIDDSNVNTEQAQSITEPAIVDTRVSDTKVSDPRASDTPDKYRMLLNSHPELSHIREVGVAVPKWNPILCASPDGLIGTEFGIEIKSPNQMYQKLIDFQNNLVQNGHPGTYDHIYNNHYDQIQGGMMIFNLSKWIYFVYCQKTNTKYLEVIPFHANHCHMLNSLGTHFYDRSVRPLLGRKKPIDPSNPDYSPHSKYLADG